MQRTAVGVAAAVTPRSGQGSAGIPPHRPIRVPGVHAYAQRSEEAGRSVDFRVSSDTQYELTIQRLASEEAIQVLRQPKPQAQPIHIGSYVHVQGGLGDRTLEALSLETWIRAWSHERDQGLITACDGDSGFGLFVLRGGWVRFLLLGRWFQAHVPLRLRQWRHVVLSWDGHNIQLFVDGGFQGSWRQTGSLRAAGIPLRLGAAGEGGAASRFLDGDLAMPAVYDRPLSAEEAKLRYEARGLALPGDGLLACWPLDEERGDSVRDASGQGRHGAIVNRATWMIGGPSFDARSVPRYAEYDPRSDPLRGHGLRFASDDLYDCRWDVTHRVGIPPTAKPGIYAGRFAFRRQGKRLQYDVTFLVRRAANRPKAPILVLCSTNTWQAYSATPFAANSSERFWETTGQDNAHPQAPAYCCYRNHEQGQPTYAIGMKAPWPAAGPEVIFSDRKLNYSHLTRGELFAHRWLERNGYEYDVASDHDLHRTPEVLSGYKVLVINGHSEYWSEEAYRGVDSFLAGGGAVIVMSGNTMFWRVSYDADGNGHGVPQARRGHRRSARCPPRGDLPQP